MSRARAVLGTPIAPRVGFANSHPRKPRVGQHLPNAREIGTAFAAWRRAQPLGAGSAYFVQPMTSPRNPNPRHE
jgi:hypothetical protein